MTENAESTQDQKLPVLTDGELASISDVRIKAKQTRPPSHYTEATLLGDMEGAGKYVEDPALRAALKRVSGLGTAATRDAFIESLKNSRYMEAAGKNLKATPKGHMFVDWLEKACPELVDVAITARWEAELDAVAEKGGGKAFSAAVAKKVTEVVATLKSQPGMVGSGFGYTPIEKSTMDDTTNGSDMPRSNKPTEKMLNFAQSVARKLNQELPAEVSESFDACKAYLDTNKDAANGPSEKQLSFANSIAGRKNLTIPAEVLANGKELSAWIDANK